MPFVFPFLSLCLYEDLLKSNLPFKNMKEGKIHLKQELGRGFQNLKFLTHVKYWCSNHDLLRNSSLKQEALGDSNIYGQSSFECCIL